MSKIEKESAPEHKENSSENKISGSQNTENNSPIPIAKKSAESSFIENLEQSVKDLWYMSETDAEINIFLGEKIDSVSKDNFAKQLKISSETIIEEKSYADFFENLIVVQDWYGEEEKKTAERFSILKKLLEENLKNLKVFKIGQIEIDIYVVGLNSQSVLMGIQTKAVET